MKSNIEDQIRPELVPRERLLWSGRPRGGLRLAGQDGLLIPFSLLWCGGITLGLIRAIRAEAGFFLLLFTPFVLSDLYLLVGRFVIYARRRSKTVCALTEQRALIVSGLVHRQVLNLPLHTMSTVELQEHGDGSGTITFGAADVWSQNGHGAGSAFAVIDDAPHVDALIRQARAERQRGDDVERAGGAVADHRGDMSAPEAEVLLLGPKMGDCEALTLALKELVVRREPALSSGQERRRLRSPKRVTVLVPAAGAGRVPLAFRSLRAVLDVYAATPSLPTGVSVSKLARGV
ncbi:MAG: hypothetical protein ACJ789_08605 [Thermomicrobiales bacterium]